MKKENLLLKKVSVVKDELGHNYLSFITTEDMEKFSIAQLKTLCGILKSAANTLESHKPFYALDVIKVLQVSTGKIYNIPTDEHETVSELTEDEVMASAAASVYKRYKSKGRGPFYE